MARVRLLTFKNTGNNKVPAIKAIRGALGLTLKDAKHAIEELEAGRHLPVIEVELDDAQRDYLEDFGRLEGTYSLDDGLDAMVRTVIDTALNEGAYAYAKDLIDVLAKNATIDPKD